MSPLSKVVIASTMAFTGLFMLSTASKAMPINDRAAVMAPTTSVALAAYRSHRRHDVTRYGYRPYYGYGYGYGYGWRRPVVGLGLGLGGVYFGL